MADSQDYEWLAERLRNPASWTEKDYSTMQFLARNNRESLERMHPLDRKRKGSVERAAAEIEVAIAAYERLRRG